MDVRATAQGAAETAADTIAVGLYAGKGISHDVDEGLLQALVDRGEARPTHRHLAVTHDASGRRWIVAGLGERDAFDPERARRVAAAVYARARELGCETLCWEVPHHTGDAGAGALVEGTVLASYRFDRYRPPKADDAPRGPGALVVSDHEDRSAAVRRAAVLAAAQNRARELQDTPANDCTPSALGDAALALGGGVRAEVEGREDLVRYGMGAFGAVASGSPVEPALITLRYDGGGEGPLIGLVGKAVTHDTGGVSIKPAAGMHRMKFDMSGGAAVLQAVAAAAELELPVRLVGVIGATENVVGARAMKPGDIVRAMDGTSIEINNTDAEGRLVLADCLLHARELGAERLVDLATLTGGIVTALGDVYAGLFANDDDLAARIVAAGEATGERVWRMPLDPAYAEMIEGRYGQIVNSIEQKGKAHPIMGAEFLHRFAGDVPWAHLDICGVGWDTGRPYAAKGGSGFGVRLLAELLGGGL